MDGGVRDRIPNLKGSLVATTDPCKTVGWRISDPIPRNYRACHKLRVAPRRTDPDEASILREQAIIEGRIQIPYYGDIGSVLGAFVSQTATIFSGTSNQSLYEPSASSSFG